MLKRYALKILLLLLPVIAGACSNEFFGIVEYKPSTFVELSERPFFFLIGRKVMYANTIGESAPTVFEAGFFSGKIEAVYPSPDETRAAIVSGRRLYVAEPGKAARLILEPVADYDAKNLGDGDVFYKTPTLQWSSDSRSIFIARDKKAKLSAQRFSESAALVRIDLSDSIIITDVIQDFRSMQYIMFGNDVICFNFAPGDGGVVWRCSQQGKVLAVRSLDEERIVLEDGTAITGKPFVSYYGNIYANEIWLTRFGFSFRNIDNRYEGFFAKGSATPIFRIRTGLNIKGHAVDGVLQGRCMVLPGGRYALIDVHHDNFKGQLLVDGATQTYRELPRNTRVYSSLNSWNYNNFQLEWDRLSFEFLPMKSPEAKEACEKRSGETCKLIGGSWWSSGQYGGK